MIAVIHAFSGRNSGDALLLRETIALLERIGVDRDTVHIFALEPESFTEYAHVEPVPSSPRREISMRMFGVGAEVARAGLAIVSRGRIRSGRLARSLSNADAIVAVGGGYLRAADLAESIGTLGNHVPQLAYAGFADAPAVYFPQSIGPLRPPVGGIVRHLLKRVDLVAVRDDRTIRELDGIGSVRRVPDLAVLQVARDLPEPAPSSREGTVVVARSLDRAKAYPDNLLTLVRALGDVEFAVQADGPGSRTDRGFYDAHDLPIAGALLDTIERSNAGIVISVRLHGALESILAGRCAIHLGYQRKSWGAYDDLGLSEFVFDARTFAPKEVLECVARIRDDPQCFWTKLHARIPVLQEQSRRFDADVRDVLASTRLLD